jgi:prevent-host-death family protein
MSKTVNMHEAKTNLSKLVQELRDGTEGEIIIAVSGTPYARLVPFEKRLRPSGMDAGLVVMAHDFDSDNDEIAKLFNDGE